MTASVGVFVNSRKLQNLSNSMTRNLASDIRKLPLKFRADTAWRDRKVFEWRSRNYLNEEPQSDGKPGIAADAGAEKDGQNVGEVKTRLIPDLVYEFGHDKKQQGRLKYLPDSTLEVEPLGLERIRILVDDQKLELGDWCWRVLQDPRPFPQFLKDMRVDRGYTVRGLAERIGAKVSVTDYEKARVPVSANLLRPYADALGVEEREFVARWLRYELERKGIAEAAVLANSRAAAYQPRAKSFGEVLRDLREQRGWSRAELADHCNVTYESIYRYEEEARLPSLKTVRHAAAALGSPSLLAVYEGNAKRKLFQSYMSRFRIAP